MEGRQEGRTDSGIKEGEGRQVKEGRKDGDVKKGWKEDRKEGRIVVSRTDSDSHPTPHYIRLIINNSLHSTHYIQPITSDSHRI
jgi:hypothetical protein